GRGEPGGCGPLPGRAGAAGGDASGGGQTVIDAQTRDLLQDIVRRQSRSVLTYVGDAYPWTTARDSRAVDALRKLIAAEAGVVAVKRRNLPALEGLAARQPKAEEVVT